MISSSLDKSTTNASTDITNAFELSAALARLGLSQYEERLRENGFEDWETVTAITETDMAELDFKRGDCRKLQRAIREYTSSKTSRGESVCDYSPLHSRWQAAVGDHAKASPNSSQQAARTTRPYRRHPRPDPHAPHRPKTAYVLFGEHVRQDPALSRLSFTDIAKETGMRWRDLSDEERVDTWEAPANDRLKQYKRELECYKQTEEYQSYRMYLEEFKQQQHHSESTLSANNESRPTRELESPRLLSTVTHPRGYPLSTLPSYQDRNALPHSTDSPQSQHNISYSRISDFRSEGKSASQPSPKSLRLTSKYDHPSYVFEESWREPRDMYAEDNVVIYLEHFTLPLTAWTTVAMDESLLNHLLLLFWIWDTTVNRVIDRALFEKDLKSFKDASKQVDAIFCSPFLVNALLALACLYTTRSTTFSVPGVARTRGASFAREAERLLPLEFSRPSLPVAQGLAALYVYEGNFGDLEKVLHYREEMYRMYERIKLNQWPDSHASVTPDSGVNRLEQGISWIHWGFYVYEWKLVQPFRCRKKIKKPSRPKLWQDQQNSLLTSEDMPDYWWFAYPLSLVAQRSMKREIFDAECSLTEIIEEVMEFLEPLKGESAARENPLKAYELYQRVIDLRLSLPERVQPEDAVHPAAILLQANIDLILMSILGPFDVTIHGPHRSIHPLSTAYRHASNIMSHVWTFRALYTLQHEFYIIQLCSVCAFRVLFDLESNSMQFEIFMKACQALYEMGRRFPLAHDTLVSIQLAAKRRNLQLPPFAMKYMTAQPGISTSTIMKHTVVHGGYQGDNFDSDVTPSKPLHVTLSALLCESSLEAGPD